jgi:hypothetical protein
MTSSIETGHAKNVEEFKRMRVILASFGAAYAPGDDRLKIPNILAIEQNSIAAMAAVDDALPDHLQAVSRREIAFTGVPQLASRALRIAETLHLDRATLNALRELVRKLYGRRAAPRQTPPATADGNDPEPERRTISVSQLSFDQRIAHFAQFIAILGGEAAYDPAEQDLGIDALAARLQEMRNANDAVTATGIPPAAARNNRNHVLYDPLVGLVDVALDAKKYVRAAFGANSGEYKELKGLEFRKIKI